MRKLIKKIAFPFLNTWYQMKTKRVNYYSKYGIRLKINPSVFHPGIFLSTNIFIDFLSQFNLKGKKVLELGAGSGMISFYAAKSGANVTASDINPKALEGLKENSKTNNITIKTSDSNVFDTISPDSFDIIIINPPYYPQEPKSNQEQAFFCGKDFEYFQKLYRQLNKMWSGRNDIYMILSEDCNIDKIKTLALSENLKLNLEYKTTKRGEKNFIFKIAITNC